MVWVVSELFTNNYEIILIKMKVKQSQKQQKRSVAMVGMCRTKKSKKEICNSKNYFQL